MKTSHILLAILAIITLTGMIASDVLLKKQYDTIDWSNPYQTFERRTLPLAKNLVIEGAPTAEIVIEQSADSTQALLLPSMARSYRTRQQSDTLFISFTMDYDGQLRDPHNDIGYELPAGMVLRLPDLQSLRITNSRLTLRKLKPAHLAVSLQNTRLRTSDLNVANAFDLTGSQNSFAVLGNDQYQSLRAIMRDSSGVRLNDTQTERFTSEVSPKAEVQLQGLALRWLSN